MSEDDQQRRRKQSSTDRDLQSPKLGFRDDSLSDSAIPTPPVPASEAITPVPIDVRADPVLYKMWRHADRRYAATMDKLSGIEAKYAGTEDVRESIRENTKVLAEHGSKLRVVWAFGGIAVLIIGIVGALAIKALWGSGLNTGTVNTTIQYLQRDLQRLEDMVEFHIRHHIPGASP